MNEETSMCALPPLCLIIVRTPLRSTQYRSHRLLAFCFVLTLFCVDEIMTLPTPPSRIHVYPYLEL